MDETVKIKIIEGTVCDAHDVFVGDIVDASPKEAQLLRMLKKAVLVEDEPPAEEPVAKGK